MANCLANCLSGMLLIIGWLILFSFWSALIYGHYYFGYVNNGLEEGHLSCYAPQDKDVLVPWDGQGAVPDSYHNVSDNFQLCARFGFYTYIGVTTAALCFQFKSTLPVAGLLSVCVPFVYSTNMLMAMIYRWRHAGKVCSGDYLPDKFAFKEAPEPYVADAGFFLVCAICSQFFACFTIMNVAGFATGITKGNL